ncbi:MAG TPA: superoxide dismutase [Woeseiaceae bacterium]|nr:superoxide dismutase [Woeseiaceae bacterium]
MKFEIPDLPYNRDALEPHISEETLNYHYGKHHTGYLNKLNKLTDGTRYEEMALEDVIRASFESEDQAVFNNAAQTWNHTFLWNSMSEDSDGKPHGSLAGKIDDKFGGLDAFRKRFKELAVGQFGSGWVWLVADGGELDIFSTPNAHNPLTTSSVPLLTLDLWEHAYYLDFQNERDRYTEAFLQYLINWEFAQANYDAIQGGGRERRSGTG